MEGVVSIMKRNKIFILYLLSICLLISFSLSQNKLNFNPTNLANVREIKENTINLKNSGFWNLTSPIEIDDAGANNWTWAEGEVWFGGGNGTQGNPYIIENVTIKGVYNVSGIFIKNSNVYFKIKNCTLINIEKDPNYGLALHSGIRLEYVNNGMLIDNNCSSNDGRGFFLVHCNNITISGNTANYNTRQGMLLQYNDDNNIYNNSVKFNGWDAIFIYQSYYNNFSGNNAWNSQHGITVQSSDSNDISDNSFNNNDGYGIGLGDSNFNTISNNSIIYNGNHGIGLIDSSNNNTISRNGVSFNYLGGVGLASSHSNSILNNTVNSNDGYGIGLGSCNYNLILDNIVNQNSARLFYYNGKYCKRK